MKKSLLYLLMLAIMPIASFTASEISSNAVSEEVSEFTTKEVNEEAVSEEAVSEEAVSEEAVSEAAVSVQSASSVQTPEVYSSKTKSTYYSDGSIKTKTKYYANGNREAYYEYYKNGKKSMIINYYTNGERQEVIRFQSNGNRTDWKKYGTSGRLVSDYNYHDNGRASQYRAYKYSSTGKQLYTDYKEYGTSGRKTVDYGYYSDGTISKKFRYTYSSKTGGMVKTDNKNYGTSGRISLDYNYYSNGKVSKKTMYKQGKMTRYIEYGTGGKVIYDSANSSSSSSYTVYKVDACDLSGDRKKNAKVDIGFDSNYANRKYYAYTNKYGQVIKVQADEIILQNDDKENVKSSGRYCSDEAKVKGTESSKYDQGHIIADSLGGVSNAYNITPQEYHLNRWGTQRDIENEIMSAENTGKDVTDFSATVSYANTSTQTPSSYKVTYKIDGKTKSYSYLNKDN